MLIVRHLILWIAFIILFTAAALSLELLEGYKVTTTEYYGLRNIGFVFIALQFLIASIFYPIILLPLSLVIRKIASSFSRVLIYCLLGGIGGILIFDKLYSDDFIQEYHLNISSAILLFGTVGLIYALLDDYLGRRQS